MKGDESSMASGQSTRSLEDFPELMQGMDEKIGSWGGGKKASSMRFAGLDLGR